MASELRYRLTSPQLEASYRAEGLARDRRFAAALMLVAVAFHLISMPGDVQLVEDAIRLREVFVIRLASALIALACLGLVYRVKRAATFDHVVSAWGALLLLGVVLANARLPTDYTSHVAWDVFLAVSVYAVLPLPIGRQVALAAIITLGDVFLFWQVKTLDRSFALADVSIAFACANLLGIMASWELNRRRRGEFLSLHYETLARAELQQALSELRTLRGIIPICASCKSIRSEAGEWQRLEAYVRNHSHAEFSHGICPSCLEELEREEGGEAEEVGRA